MMRAENMSYEDLKTATEGWIVRPCPPQFLPMRPGLFTPITLPMLEAGPNENERVHWIDYVTTPIDAVDIEASQRAWKEAMEKKTWTGIPEPFGFKDPDAVPENTRMQICVFRANGENHYIVKHCIFKNKMKAALFRGLCFGQPHKMTFEHPKIGMRVWQYAFQNLGGYLCLCNQLSSEATVKEGGNTTNLSDKSDEEIDAGFAYISKEARGKQGVALLLWQTKALKNSTPIQNWPTQLTKEIIRLIVTEGTLVKKENKWPLTLTPAHFQTWFLDIAEDIYEFDNVALGLLGDSGTGKSPTGRTVLLSQARNNKVVFECDDEPCMRVTTEFDFLRGELGNVCMADFLDDGGVFMILLKAMLAFTDVGLFEAVAWARWGLTKWVQGQPRGFSDNAHYAIDTKNEWPSLDHKQFVQVIQPSIHEKATEAHVDALLKRTAYVVVTSTWTAWRPAGTQHVEVKRKFMNHPEFLTELGKEWYGKYRAGCRSLPENHAELVEQEQFLSSFHQLLV
jgi:hypothetical protein